MTSAVRRAGLHRDLAGVLRWFWDRSFEIFLYRYLQRLGRPKRAIWYCIRHNETLQQSHSSSPVQKLYPHMTVTAPRSSRSLCQAEMVLIIVTYSTFSYKLHPFSVPFPCNILAHTIYKSLKNHRQNVTRERKYLITHIQKRPFHYFACCFARIAFSYLVTSSFLEEFVRRQTIDVSKGGLTVTVQALEHNDWTPYQTLPFLVLLLSAENWNQTLRSDYSLRSKWNHLDQSHFRW